VNVQSQQQDSESLLHAVRRMIAVRKTLPVLAQSPLDWLYELPLSSMCFWRRSAEGAVLALHNLSEEPLTVSLPDGAAFADALHPEAGLYQNEVTLGAYGYRWLVPVE